MPDKTVPYREWKVVRFYRCKERLTLVQYFVLAGVAYLLTVAALLAIVWWLVPHSWLPHPLVIWPIVAVLVALVMAVHQTWQRRQTQRHQPARLPDLEHCQHCADAEPSAPGLARTAPEYILHGGVVVATHAQRLREDQADRAPRARVAQRVRDATADLTVTWPISSSRIGAVTGPSEAQVDPDRVL